MKKYILTIQNIVKETNDTITISFKQPSLRKINYEAGQYISLLFKINDFNYIRPYSFSSSPSSDELLDITIKRLNKGIVSNYIHDQLKIGDIIETHGPLGDFYIKDEHKEKNLYLWAAGSGITPLFSILKNTLFTTNNKITLIYANKSIKSTIFYDRLNKIKKDFSNRFEFYNLLSEEKNNNTETNIYQKLNNYFIESIKNKNTDFIDSLHLICGPQKLKQELINKLKTIGVSDNSILFEDYNVIINNNELLNVIDSRVYLNINNTHNEIFVPKGISILKAALEKRIEISYSCQTGNCKKCIAQISNGSIKMIGNESDNLNKEEILLCCSYPTTEKVNITFNN